MPISHGFNSRRDHQKIINDNLRKYFNPMRKHHIGIPGHNRGNSLDHELAKLEIALHLERDGHTVLLEGELKNGGGRPDLVVLDVSPPICYEIVCSETDKSLMLKQEKYGDMRIIKVKP